jgi:hypothetical protein
VRANSHAARHRTRKKYRSRSGSTPSRRNSISISDWPSVTPTRRRPTVPVPVPSNVRSGRDEASTYEAGPTRHWLKVKAGPSPRTLGLQVSVRYDCIASRLAEKVVVTSRAFVREVALKGVVIFRAHVTWVEWAGDQP